MTAITKRWRRFQCWRKTHEWEHRYDNAGWGTTWNQCRRCGLTASRHYGVNLQDWP